MSKKDIARAKGRLAGIRESGWTCGDCGNFYDATVDHCPNQLLNEAIVDLARVQARHKTWSGAPKHDREQQPQFGYLAPERTADGKAIVVGPFDTHAEAVQAAGDNSIVEMGAHEDTYTVSDVSERPAHLGGCPCAEGPCCPWMGDCTCQCMCDFIARIEERVRSEYDPSENDADEGYRAGYATAVAEFTSNHNDDATFQLGYKKALLDVIEKSRTEPAAAFGTVEKLMRDLKEESS